MIRYRRLYEADNSDDYTIRRGDTVEYAGYEWIVLKIEGEVVTLIARHKDFGEEQFGSESNLADYKKSYVRAYLKNKVYPELKQNGIYPLLTKLNDVGVSDHVWLLSEREAWWLLNDSDRKFENMWWLRSSNTKEPLLAAVGMNGRIYVEGEVSRLNYSTPLAIRPAIRVNIGDFIRRVKKIL